MPACKGCGAAIVWVTTAKGKSMPLDAEETTTHDPQVIRYTRDGRLAELVNGVKTGHVAHWVTCSQRERFKKKKGEGT